MEGGTRLTMVHEGFDVSDPMQRMAQEKMSGGWLSIVGERLPAALVEGSAAA